MEAILTDDQFVAMYEFLESMDFADNHADIDMILDLRYTEIINRREKEKEKDDLSFLETFVNSFSTACDTGMTYARRNFTQEELDRATTICVRLQRKREAQ